MSIVIMATGMIRMPYIFPSFIMHHAIRDGRMHPMGDSDIDDYDTIEQFPWVYKVNRSDELPDSGWKIHISAPLQDCLEILAEVVPVLQSHRCTYKYAKPIEGYLKILEKRSSRLQSGKFITAYPKSTFDANVIMRELARETLGRKGPKVITDRLYRDSKIISYRYGAFGPPQAISEDGELTSWVRHPNGGMFKDQRLPTFALPDGIDDPFKTSNEIAQDYSGDYRIGSHQILGAIRFSNAGGIYRAVDSRGNRYVIKEARPGTGFVGLQDAQARLHQEMLNTRVASSILGGTVARLVEKLHIEDHIFAVFEEVDGMPLYDWIANNNPLARGAIVSQEAWSTYCHRASDLLSEIRDSAARLDEAGLSHGDLSTANIIVTSDDHIRLIDFECLTPSSSSPPDIRTPEFSPVDGATCRTAGEAQQFAISCISLALIHRINAIEMRNGVAFSSLSYDLDSRRLKIPDEFIHEIERLSANRVQDNVLTLFAPHQREVSDTMPRTVAIEKAKSLLIPPLLHHTNSVLTFDNGADRALPSGSPYPRLGFKSGLAGILYALNTCKNLSLDSLHFRFRSLVLDALKSHYLPVGFAEGAAGIMYYAHIAGDGELSEACSRYIAEHFSEVSNVGLSTGLSGVFIAAINSLQYGLARRSLSELVSAARSLRSSFHDGTLSDGLLGLCSALSIAERSPHLRGNNSVIINELFLIASQGLRRTDGGIYSYTSRRDKIVFKPYLRDGTMGYWTAFKVCEPYLNRDSLTRYSKFERAASLENASTPFVIEGGLADGRSGILVGLCYLHDDDIYTLPLKDLGIVAPHCVPEDILARYCVPVESGAAIHSIRTGNPDYGYESGSAGLLSALSWMEGLSPLMLFGGLHLESAHSK